MTEILDSQSPADKPSVPTPRTDEVLRIENNFGAYRGSDGMDGVTAQEAHDACFSNLAHLARKLEREIEDWRGRLAEMSGRFLATQSAGTRTAPEGHGEPCYYCGTPCNGLAGDPGQWPIPLCHADDPGRVKWHHSRCVHERLIENQATRSASERIPIGLRAARLDCVQMGEGARWTVPNAFMQLVDEMIDTADSRVNK